MKLTPRMKNGMIQGFFANIIFLLIFAALLMFYVSPKIQSIESYKQELGNLYTTLLQIRKTGLSFEALRAQVSTTQSAQDPYVQTLLRNVDASFYAKSFTNTGAQDYQSFLKNLKIQIESEKNSSEYIQKEEVIQSILPVYQTGNKTSGEEMNDFYFTNYIENILYSFNLKSEGEIGVGQLIQVSGVQKDGSETQEASPENAAKNALDENIFKIPLSFSVTGQKGDIIDFIHFFENVGSVELQGNSFEVYTDKFIPKVLDGAKNGPQYNIYSNQIADISRINILNYPDSSSIVSSKSFMNLIKSDQAREKFSAEMEVGFYVTGLPTYMLQKHITDLLTELQGLYQNMNQDTQKYTPASAMQAGIPIEAISKLKSLHLLLGNLVEELKTLQQAFVQSDDKYKVYDDFLTLSQQAEIIQQKYEQQKKILLSSQQK